MAYNKGLLYKRDLKVESLRIIITSGWNTTQVSKPVDPVKLKSKQKSTWKNLEKFATPSKKGKGSPFVTMFLQGWRLCSMWRGVFDMGTVRNPRAPKSIHQIGEPPDTPGHEFPRHQTDIVGTQKWRESSPFYNFRYVICISKAYVREFPHSLKQP